ncbi:HDIG domain-containing protein [Thermanaerosceptrum fracticalcis]|uniref:HDIG domain-containing protein n=1 Tax=Thermanaerosceptrum fracticalcis TaxID=1712410 RepID=A0A7G6E232_THEFR|nr:HDIG domain-containing metalloprotein [Thermanaerosceptrum fracticalcis]QNB46136.1 HDIG domain-containing protein [Thermanaerosceptrum fracticalcis]
MNRKVRRFTWFLIFFLGIMGIFATHFLPENYSLKEGEVAPYTIKARQTITFEDAKKTAERKRLAAEKIPDVYVMDKKVLSELEEDIARTFQDFLNITKNDALDNKEKVRTIKNEFKISEDTANNLLTIETETIKALRAETISLVRAQWQNGVKTNEVDERLTKIFSQVELLNIKASYKELIKGVLHKVEFRPNHLLDEDATRKAREEAQRNEGPVFVTIRKDQKIVGEGEVVTAEHIEILKLMGYQRTASPYVTVGGIGLFVLLMLVLTILFLRHYRRDLYRKENNLLLLSLLFFITLLLAKLIATIKISPQPQVAELVGYLIPISAGSMLVAILLDTKLAIFLTTVLSFFVGILTGNQLSYAINAFTGGLVGIYSVSKFSQRLDWVKAGLFVALAQIITIISLGLMNNSSWQLMLIGSFLGLLNGLFSAIFAYGSLPFLESGFKVTTSVRLLELSNPNHPLLKRLLFEAPGTYHHSILVGNLGEAAADAVGADSLLVRVGAYYHDIGKLKRPYFFIENQLGGENPHEKLTPSLSTLIITSHVKDGVELAKQHGIPPVIIDLIQQHHGTSLATYFYHKALELGNADNVKESDYRYDAPKPQSKEAAIIMLADNVEAAVRSMTSTSSGKIEGLVRKIIKERLQDGQLDESALTFKDLDLIATAFTRILSGIFHSRIEYPENVLQAMEGSNLLDGDLNRQSTDENSGNTGDGENNS